jgi:quinolinate synthase
MKVWDPDLEMGGLSAKEIQDAKVLLWKGHCSVHQVFQLADIQRFRHEHPEGMVISHPECCFEICQASDYVGSTDFIMETIRAADPGTCWQVATELNLVNRLSEEVKSEGKIVKSMSPLHSMCPTMQLNRPQHLVWILENLLNGEVVNQITVPEHEKKYARLALERMLAAS